MRLIDADELKKELKDMDVVLVNHNVEDWIDEQPTIKFCVYEKHGGVCKNTGTYCNLGACPYEDLKEFAVVRHGKWERIPYSFVGGYRCSCCGAKSLDDNFDYCGHCGAKMDGE